MEQMISRLEALLAAHREGTVRLGPYLPVVVEMVEELKHSIRFTIGWPNDRHLVRLYTDEEGVSRLFIDGGAKGDGSVVFLAELPGVTGIKRGEEC